MAEAGRELWRLRQGPLGQAAQDQVLVAFGDVQGGRRHNVVRYVNVV